MRQRYDDYFSAMARLKKGGLSGKEKNTQMNRIHAALQDWGTRVFDDVSFEWFVNFEEYGILPYAGSWTDQPRYVQQELHHWAMLKRFWELNEDLPSAEGLPTLDDLITLSQKGT